MKTYKYPDKKDWEKILQRPANSNDNVKTIVKKIIDSVKKDGDKALHKYSKEFDNVNLQSFAIEKSELENSVNKIDSILKKSIDIAYENIYKFHYSQKREKKIIETSAGIKCWQKDVAIEKIGLYIPGGTAPLFSTILMIGIPAKIAGCKEIILCSPPNKNGKLAPEILYTAYRVGIEKVFIIGGAQAIGAMTFGTESIPAVNKIYGPGNQFVTYAKQLVSEIVAIDMPAGPSEVAVIGDSSANPIFVASDLLAQAEHGTDSQSIFITDTKELIEKVKIEVEKQLNELPRKNIASKSLEHSRIILMKNLDEAMEISNYYAPEHLILLTKNAENYSEKVINAGSVFIGEYAPESAGDFLSGTNHVLPTYGFAKNHSGLSLNDFVKRITFQSITEDGLKNVGFAMESMAEAEKLQGHKNAVSVRLEEIKRITNK